MNYQDKFIYIQSLQNLSLMNISLRLILIHHLITRGFRVLILEAPKSVNDGLRNLLGKYSIKCPLCFVAATITSIVIVMVLTLSTLSSSDEYSIDLYREMNKAMYSLSYEGIYVVSSKNNLDAIRIEHINNSTGVKERLLSLTGEARKVYRNDSQVTFTWPNSQSRITMKAMQRKLFSSADYAAINSKNYLFQSAPDGRVVGRSAYVIDILAKDEMRYGNRFWIDKLTKMKLRSSLIDANGFVLEQMMFTKLSIPENFALDYAYPNIGMQNSSAQTLPETQAPADSALPVVTFDTLPSSFQKIADLSGPRTAAELRNRHILLSDGMTSISIFIQFGKFSNKSDSTGISKLGPITAYGRDLGSGFATVIGKVPEATVRVVGDAIKLSPVGR